jgi:hypothetical protein
VFNTTFNKYFRYIVVVSFIGGGNWNLVFIKPGAKPLILIFFGHKLPTKPLITPNNAVLVTAYAGIP